MTWRETLTLDIHSSSYKELSKLILDIAQDSSAATRSDCVIQH